MPFGFIHICRVTLPGVFPETGPDKPPMMPSQISALSKMKPTVAKHFGVFLAIFRSRCAASAGILGVLSESHLGTRRPFFGYCCAFVANFIHVGARVVILASFEPFGTLMDEVGAALELIQAFAPEPSWGR